MLLERADFVPPYDALAAATAARLEREAQDLKTDATGDRRLLRADAVVVATAKRHGAGILISHDARCRQLAARVSLKAEDLPRMAGDLLEDLPIPEDR